ncbi:hypothetical protein BD311DRAFT_768104 [Dichomitus squalens]|uniref:Uncharacterized protein n=1 Tax=Dichomitus squalens TaxID=114155 RepID=A0A4Q9MD48_9APHY|nr:hypothetical protein BD311DRAFT_768104 [Dichomitus squalens]
MQASTGHIICPPHGPPIDVPSLLSGPQNMEGYYCPGPRNTAHSPTYVKVSVAGCMLSRRMSSRISLPCDGQSRIFARSSIYTSLSSIYRKCVRVKAPQLAPRVPSTALHGESWACRRSGLTTFNGSDPDYVGCQASTFNRLLSMRAFRPPVAGTFGTSSGQTAPNLRSRIDSCG